MPFFYMNGSTTLKYKVYLSVINETKNNQNDTEFFIINLELGKERIYPQKEINHS